MSHVRPFLWPSSSLIHGHRQAGRLRDIKCPNYNLEAHLWLCRVIDFQKDNGA